MNKVSPITVEPLRTFFESFGLKGEPQVMEEMDIDTERATSLASAFLQTVMPGESWEQEEELFRTPERFAKMLMELTKPVDFEFTTFPNTSRVEGSSELVTVKDISFVSLCKHHIAPFVGHCHIGYIPGERIAGLSKFARTVRWWSAGIWTQESLTHAIAGYLDDELNPLGLIVMMEAEHMCMTIRGSLAPGTKTTTTQLRGLFLDPPQGRDPKAEFLTYVGR